MPLVGPLKWRWPSRLDCQWCEAPSGRAQPTPRFYRFRPCTGRLCHAPTMCATPPGDSQNHARGHDDSRPLPVCSGASGNRLPDRVDRRVIAAAWATLAVQVGIVATGGLVRLTGSGLGCPTWPQCTGGSLVATPEMGIHGVIEFGNRLLTFVLVVVAIVMFLFVIRMRAERRDLFWLSLGDRPLRPAAGDHRRHHGAHEPEPVRRGPSLPRLRRSSSRSRPRSSSGSTRRLAPRRSRCRAGTRSRPT